MTLRELLQIELWSKRTTRKIFVVLGIVVVGFVGWFAIQQYWLTPGERRTGRAILAQIDKLQDFDTASGEVFEGNVKQIRAQIDVADKAAWTNRDTGMARGLGFYLDLTKIDEEEVKRLETLRRKDSPISFKDEALENDMIASGAKARLFLRAELHAALD